MSTVLDTASDQNSQEVYRQEQEYLKTVLAALEDQYDHQQRQLKGISRSPIDPKNYNQANINAHVAQGAKRAIDTIPDQKKAPYFGRMDILEKGNSTEETIYIGLSPIRRDAVNNWVYDWRAPIGGLYNGCEPGPIPSRMPGILIDGKMLLKRRYEIADGQVKKISDADSRSLDESGAAVDSMLLSVLKRNSTGQMHQIVQSIQREQDAVIRTNGDVVVVQGPAGSGKTIIALHRAAYLLYHMRERQERQSHIISASRMLVFSPNQIFSEYISRVMPDLREDQIRQIVLENQMRQYLNTLMGNAKAHHRVEGKEDHHEYIIEAAGGDEYNRRWRSSRFKSSLAMYALLQAMVAQIEEVVQTAFTDVFDDLYDETLMGLIDRLKEPGTPAKNVLYRREDLVERFYRGQRRHAAGVLSGVRDVTALFKEEASILDQERSRRERTDDRVTPMGGPRLVQPQEQVRLRRQAERLRREAVRLEGVVTRMEASLAPIALYQALWETDAAIKALQQTGADTETAKFIRDQTLLSLTDGTLPYEDLTPILLLQGLLRGFPSLGDVDHAIVDEAQDYSLLQYEYMRNCLPERCSLTIVGDLNQGTDPALNISDYDSFKEIFPTPVTLLELTKSYRSSCEITEFAERILGTGMHIENVRRTGRKPTMRQVATEEALPQAIADAVSTLTTRDMKSIAILCRTRRDARMLHKRLSPILDAVLLTDETAKIPQGVFILPIYWAKGLEFDAVILDDVGKLNYRRASEAKLLYTACTRALHELYLLHVGAISDLIPSKQEKLFDVVL